MLIAVCLSGVSFGQDFQDKPDALSADEKRNESQVDKLEEARKKWREAMEGLDFPLILFTQQESEEDSKPGPGFVFGGDPTYARGLSSLIQNLMFTAEAGTDLLDAESAEAAAFRDAEAVLKEGGAFDEVDALLQSVNADYAVVLEYLNLPDGKFRVLGRIVDARRGRRYDTAPATIPGGDQKALRRGGEALFQGIADIMVRIASPSAKIYNYTVKLQGSKQVVSRIREISEAVAGLNGVKSRNVRFGLDNGWYSARVRYDDGALYLASDLQKLLQSKFGLRCTVMQADGGVIARLNENLGAPLWRILADPAVDDPKGVRADFRERYEFAGRPRVAVLLRSGPELSMVAAELEAALEAALIEAGLDVKSGSELRDAIGRSLVFDPDRPEGEAVDEEAVTDAVFGLDGVDMFVTGTIFTESDSQRLGDSRVQIRMITRQSKRMLGVVAWPSKKADADADYRVDRNDDGDIGTFLAGSILDVYHRMKLMSGKSIEVIVSGLGSSRQLTLLADNLEVAAGVLGVVDPRFDAGSGRFTIRYEGAYEDCQRSVQQVLGAMMFEAKIDESTLEILRISVRPRQ